MTASPADSSLFERLEVPSAYQMVFKAIEGEIVAGRLREGDRLPTETALADQFGLNRSTVREGIRLLEQAGLVRREAGRRLHVSLPHAAELAPRVSRAMVMQRVTFRELWRVAMALEPAAAAEAALGADPAHLERLEENLAATLAAAEAGQPITPWDVEFHTLIAEATGNRALILCREPMSLLFYPAIRPLFGNHAKGHTAVQRLIAAHGAILTALKSGDAATAEAWMRRHIVDFKRGYDVQGLDMDAAVDRRTAPE
ncbi:FadR/GntR family transcriptional regulator [Roseospirillum parvum]|uniref:DNA-binding transcriptional regulator, FadR family n=1 Tax=Roseospirillum parvum TaxID=83401 RepID=A0A1G7UQR4_9PROT|nr:FCD domain-containing protein [Roseospirillum parvum]SDG49892.1 DNA-binding transcriptional regulator, FadR family [Roseospirillum parvum]